MGTYRGRRRAIRWRERRRTALPPIAVRPPAWTAHWASSKADSNQRPVLAEPGYSRRSAIRQFARGADLCQQRDARKLLWLCRRTSDPVASVRDEPGRGAGDARVETCLAQSAVPDRHRSGNRTHRTTRTHGHDTCPSAAASMRRSRRSSGSQEPRRATKRLAASTMGPPVP